MFALLITHDGRGGHFYSSTNGDPLVAVTVDQKRYLEEIALYEEHALLVDLGSSWPFSVTTVRQERRMDPFYPPADILAYDQVA